jgi:hypothetical protein
MSLGDAFEARLRHTTGMQAVKGRLRVCPQRGLAPICCGSCLIQTRDRGRLPPFSDRLSSDTRKMGYLSLAREQSSYLEYETLVAIAPLPGQPHTCPITLISPNRNHSSQLQGSPTVLFFVFCAWYGFPEAVVAAKLLGLAY